MNCLRRRVPSKQETLLGRAAWVEGRRVRETENCSATWFTVSGFMVIGLVSGLSLASHSEWGCFLGAHTSLSQDGFQRGGYWEVGRTYGLESHISFDISWILVGGSLLVPCFLPVPLVVRWLLKSGFSGAWQGWVVSGSLNSLSLVFLNKVLHRVNV